MSVIAKIIKKTPLKAVWNGAKNSTLGKKYRAKRTMRLNDKLFFEELPAAYNSQVGNPVQEDKIIFVETRYETMSNNFRTLYDTLKEGYAFNIHVHYLKDTLVPKKEFEANCARMLEDAATAKYVFLNEASRPISCVNLRPETIVTQLWHGCGAFKKFGMSTAELIFGTSKEQMIRHPYNKNYTYVTVSSPEVVWAYAEAMDMKDRQEAILPIGTSRTDVFFREENMEAARRKLESLMPAAKGKKVILYAPTFRGRVAKATTPDHLSVEKFAEAFSDEYVLLFKHHPIVKSRPEIPEEYQGTFAMDVSDEMIIDDLLFVSDICISDYSSLIFEYSLFERPMIFFAYDLDEYFEWRGFYYNYDELTPGPVFKENEEMIDYIRNIEERFDKQKVADFREKFMSACDGHATERIMNLVFGEALEKYRK